MRLRTLAHSAGQCFSVALSCIAWAALGPFEGAGSLLLFSFGSLIGSEVWHDAKFRNAEAELDSLEGLITAAFKEGDYAEVTQHWVRAEELKRQFGIRLSETATALTEESVTRKHAKRSADREARLARQREDAIAELLRREAEEATERARREAEEQVRLEELELAR